MRNEVHCGIIQYSVQCVLVNILANVIGHPGVIFKNILLANVIVLFANMICEIQFLVVLYIIIFLHNTCMFHYQHVLYSSKV